MNINQYPKFDPLKSREAVFGGVRNEEATSLFHLDFPYNINERIIKNESGGGGTIVHASGMAVISTAASTQSSGVLRSRETVKYHSGQGAIVHSAVMFSEGVTESQQLAGVGDNLCGFFFGYSGVQFGVVHRCVAADTFVPQTEWNIDPMADLDPLLGNMYRISYQMGFGKTIFEIQDGNTGNFEPVHRFDFGNNRLFPATLNPNLPFTTSVLNTGNDSILSISLHSMGAFVEGRDLEQGLVAASGTTGTSTTTITPLISYRNKEIFQNRQNQVTVDLLRASANNSNNQTVEFVFFINAILTGASFIDFNSETSVMEIDVAATAITNGSQIISGFIKGISSDTFNITDLLITLSPGDTVTIATRKVSGSAGTADASLIWREDF